MRHVYDKEREWGQIWSEPSSIEKNLIGGQSVPFGEGVRMNRGIMTAFHYRA